MSDLITRLEEAAEGCPLLDRELWVALEFDGRSSPIDAPEYTTSIDAAYALAERVLGRIGARICLAQVVGCRLQGDEPVVPGIARALCSAVLRTTFRANHKDKP